MNMPIVAGRKISTQKMGFTIIELLVVVCIIGLLVSIILVTLKSARDKAKTAAILQFSASIKHALGAYVMGEFKFEGNENDSSGVQGTTMTNHSVTFTPNNLSGEMGQAGNFNGSAYIQANNPAILNSLKDFTYSVWAKPAVLSSGWNEIIDIDNDKQLLAFANGKVAIYGRCGTHSLDSVSTGNWYHLVWAVLGANYKIYLNGKEIGAGVGCSSSISGSNMMVGAGYNGISADEYFNGLIDEAQIYSTSLSLTQIRQLYAQGLARH